MIIKHILPTILLVGLPAFSPAEEPTETPRQSPPQQAVVEPVAEVPVTAPQQATPCNCPSCQCNAQGQSATYKTCCNGQLIDWSKYPETIRPMPRPGIFPIAPMQGENYYSLVDQLSGTQRAAGPKSGYAPSAIQAWPFFDSDWRYVESIPLEDRTLVEQLKRIHLDDCWMFSTGGEFWSRYHHEHNSRLTQTDNEYNLMHVRLYGDLWYGDSVRIYGEYIWADIHGEDLPPTLPDADRGDIQNLFVDLKLFELGNKPVYIRAGRQELLYGSQRLVSPLPWANKRHSFDGVKVFRQGENWDFDAFWTKYVPADAGGFDEADDNQEFGGAWLTYRPKAGEFIDWYYLMYDNENPAIQQGIIRQPFQTHTFGSRWTGDNNGWLWDFEGALQFGDQGNSDLFAGMGTAGVGRAWKDATWSPTLWLYYDYASGDDNPVAGDVHTFNQQFPFGHYYLGWMDLVGRQNIHDLNAHLYFYPAPWLTTWIQYHHFWLDESRDALYNAGGVALRRDLTGQAGTNVGDEIDFVLNFHVARYTDILVSYNKLYGGSFLEQTAGPGRSENAESVYLLFTQRF